MAPGTTVAATATVDPPPTVEPGELIDLLDRTDPAFRFSVLTPFPSDHPVGAATRR